MTVKLKYKRPFNVEPHVSNKTISAHVGRQKVLNFIDRGLKLNQHSDVWKAHWGLIKPTRMTKMASSIKTAFRGR